MRFLSPFFMLAAIFCSLVAGYEKYCLSPSPPLKGFEIGQTDYHVMDFPVGSHEYQTTIFNPSALPRRVLGIAGQCTGNFCFTSVQSAPVLIPPNGSLVINCILEVKSPGPIDAEIKIYLEENGIRTVTLRVTGTAVEGPHAPK